MVSYFLVACKTKIARSQNKSQNGKCSVAARTASRFLDLVPADPYPRPMNTVRNVSIKQLKRAVIIREKIDSLQRELTQILGGEIPIRRVGKRKMSAAARARIGAAQRVRWAKVKGASAKPKRKMSAAGRAAISAAAKVRWKKAKAAGKTRL